jgi:hypothetical protein
MVYVNSNAQWSQYNKILVQPVEFWDDPSTSVSASDQQMLGDYFYNKLKEDLSKDFTLVDQPGPGVLVLRVAIVNATTATPGLRTVSVIVPQARVLNGIQSLATGSYAFAGSAEAEMKATDGATNQFVAGAIDNAAVVWRSNRRPHGSGVMPRPRWTTGQRGSRVGCLSCKGERRLDNKTMSTFRGPRV